jgi:uncharacterized protein YlxP (DUF503 family)
MVIGILQFDLFIDGACSLKDKRRVLASLKDRLHREHLCSVAEVGDPDVLNHARVGVALVGREGARVGQILDRICAKLRGLTDAQVGDIDRQILDGQDYGRTPTEMDLEPGVAASLRRELLERAGEAEEGQGA